MELKRVPLTMDNASCHRVLNNHLAWSLIFHVH